MGGMIAFQLAVDQPLAASNAAPKAAIHTNRV